MDARYGVTILHLSRTSERQGAASLHLAAPKLGTTDGSDSSADAFVHCCTWEQLPGVVARFYAGVPDLVAYEIDPERLGGAELVWEAPAHPDGSPNTEAEAADRFPHVYGPIPWTAVIAEHPVEPS